MDEVAHPMTEAGKEIDRTVTVPWHGSDTPIIFRRFEGQAEWIEAVGEFELRSTVPKLIASKYERALNLYRLAWSNLDLIKSAELAAFAALELALRNRFGNRPLAQQLEFLVTKHGLTNAGLPSIGPVKGTAVDRLAGDASPSLARIRNGLAHGDPSEGGPIVGLMPLIRDLIDFTYDPARP